MGDLTVDTAVEGSDGSYRATLSRDWEIWGPNGGYIAAVALRAAGAYARFERPVTLVGHFLGVADFESPVDLAVTTLREAKRAQSVRAALVKEFNLSNDQLIAVGYGTEQLKNPKDPYGSENRRVQIVNVGQQ